MGECHEPARLEQNELTDRSRRLCQNQLRNPVRLEAPDRPRNAQKRRITAAEVAKNDGRGSNALWVVIDDQVYESVRCQPFRVLAPAADPSPSHSLTEYVEMHVRFRKSGFERVQLVLTRRFTFSSPAEQKCCNNRAART